MTSDHGLSWRIALLGALSALAGALIGSLTSVEVANKSYDQQRSIRLQDQRKDAYTALFTAVEQQDQALKQLKTLERDHPQIDTKSPEFARLVLRQTQRVDNLADAFNAQVALVFVYGSFKAVKAAANLQEALGDARSAGSVYAVGQLPLARHLERPFFKKQEKAFDKALDTVQKRISELILTMRSDFDVPPF